MMRSLLWMLLVMTGAAGARPDIFLSREWEPDFRVQRSSLFAEGDSGGVPVERQVFTCLLSVADLQLRRCDAPDNPDSLRTGCYRAEYEISLVVFTGKGRHRVSRASRYHHDAFTLESSRPEELDPRRWRHFEVELPPGSYTWWVEFQDLNSRRHLRREGRLVVADLSKESAAIGGLWLLAEADSLAPDPMTSKPYIEERGGSHPAELIVYYEVWSRESAARTLSSLILDRRDRERHQRELTRTFPAGVTHNLLRVPLQELGSGDYQLELTLRDGAEARGKDVKRGTHARDSARSWRPGADGPRKHADARRRWSQFTVRWSGEPGNPSDLERAVEQLRYLLPPKRFKELQLAPMSQKKAMFDEFWNSVDPSPDGEVNELMAEYYRRAEFADRRFSWSRFAGWRSDRGRIYMIHGDPDQVERQGSDLDHPAWERWIYEESGREFFFVDRMGFGDFQLVIDPGN